MMGKHSALWQDGRFWLIVALAVAIRASILTYLFFNPSGMFANGDSHGYQKLAFSIVHHGTFSKEPAIAGAIPDYIKPIESISYAAPLAPDEYRTPAYPVFLALIYFLGGTPYTAVIVQSFLSLILLWLTVVTAGRVFGHRAALMAGALAAIEPLSLIYSHEIMSDTPFVLMVAAATLTFLSWVLDSDSDKSFKLPIASGIFMGLAVMVRPMATYLPIAFAALAALYLYMGKREISCQIPTAAGNPIKPAAKPLAMRVFLFMLAAFLIVSTWMARNYVVFGRAFISTASDHVLLITAGSQLMAEEHDHSGAMTTQQFRDRLEGDLVKQMEREGKNAASPPERATYFRNWAIGVIKAHPGRFILYMMKSTVSLFVSDITGMYQILGFTSEAKGGWGILFRSGPKAALSKYFGPQWPAWVAGSAPMILFDLTVYILALLGALRLWRNGSYFLFFFFVITIAYWTAASAIASMPRYRFPMMPFLICLAAGAVSGPWRSDPANSAAS